MEELFGGNGMAPSVGGETAGTEVTTDEAKKAAKKEAKSAKVQAYKEALNETIASDPTFLNKAFAQSETIAVVKTLATLSQSGLIHNKAGDKKGPDGKLIKDLKSVPAVIGYLFKNTGKNPITYTTAVWSQAEDGKFVSEVTERVAKPGAEFQLTRQYATMLVARPEYSFKIQNGTFVESSKKISITGTEVTPEQLKATLEAYYFKFADASLSVNSDKVKVIIDTKIADDKFEVKPEYVECFGYINNDVVKAERTRKPSAPSIDPQVFAANYINSLIKKHKGE